MNSFHSTLVRYRRLSASGSSEVRLPYSYVACELHQDGSGAFASVIDTPCADPDDPRTGKLVDNNHLVLGIAAALRMLGTHARDRTAAGGLATIWPTGEDTPIWLVSNVGMRNEQAGPAALREQPSADAVADLDDLATDGPGQVAATYRLASGLHQAFGTPEAPLLTADGAVRIRYWHPTAHQNLTTWAATNDIQVFSDVLQ